MHRSPNKVSRGNKQNIARLFLLESPTRLDIICESGGNRTDGLNKTLTQNINLCAGSSHFVTSLISSFTGARGRYLHKAIIPAQQQPLPQGLCTFKIAHDQKPAGRSPAPVTCCLQILRNRVYHGLRCYLISAQNQHHHLGYSLQPLPADDGGGFGMQHFHPGLRLSQLSDVPPYAGPAAKKIRAWCDKTDDVSASPHSFAPLC